MTDARLQALERLKAGHTFPGPFTFKAIGANTSAFAQAVAQSAVAVVGPGAHVAVASRQSEAGRHQAVTLQVRVQSPEQVLEIYALLAGIDGLKMVL